MQAEKFQVCYQQACQYCFVALMVAFFCQVMMVTCALGVVISEGDGSGNTSAPADDPGMANLGTRGSATAIYLGNRWVLTAAHVGAGTVTLGGETYVADLSTTERVMNPPGLTDYTDIVLFQLEETPPLPSLHLACQSVSLGQEVVMAGRGRNRRPEPSFWDVTPVAGDDNDIWRAINATSPKVDKKGYETDTTKSIRWGKNIVSLTGVEIGIGYGTVLSFKTSFDTLEDLGRIDFEAQGVTGDSGGAAFAKNGSTWELVGMIHAVDIEDNQPGGAATAIYGNETYIADLFRYADQLRAIADFEPAPGDFDGDGKFTARDIDRLTEEVRAGDAGCHFDLNADERVSLDDLNVWLTDVAGSLPGDTDLDGEVTFTDFLAVSTHLDKPGGWQEGDFSGDGFVDFHDFVVFTSNFGKRFEGVPAAAAAVPEPAGVSLLIASLLWWPAVRRRGRNAPGR